MSLLHRLRLGANKVLGPFGLSIDRTEKTKWIWGKSVITTQVGRYSIDIPNINPLAKVYLSNPNYSSQLGRLAAIVRGKYINLEAIDIGANVGDTACIIKSAVNIPLICIEGDAAAFKFLKKNTGQFHDVIAHQLFLGEKTGVISANFEKTGWNTTIRPDKTNTAPLLKVTSLDDFLAEQSHIENVKLLKIDAEGFDCSILRGGVKFIQRVSPVITFEYNRYNMNVLGENGLDTLAMLAGLDYLHIFFHDCVGGFFCSANMSDRMLIRDLHNYANGTHGESFYFDITVFHKSDGDIAQAFAQEERTRQSI